MIAKTQTSSQPSGLIGSSLLRANGIVPSIINDLNSVPYEKFKNKMFGAWNLLLSLASAIIMGRFALQWMTDMSAFQFSETTRSIVCVSVGVFWFIGYLLMSIIVQLGLRKEKGRFFLNVAKAVPRIIFAILMSLLVTDPFILQSFESDIKNEIGVVAEEAYNKKASEVTEEQKRIHGPEIESLVTQKGTMEKRLDENAKINEERISNLAKSTGRRTQRQIFRLDSTFRNVNDTYTKNQNNTNAEISRIAGLIQQAEVNIKTKSETEAAKTRTEALNNMGYFAQHNALFHFARREPYAGFKILATLLFVLFLELMTVLFKVFAKYSAYEAELDRLQTLDEEASETQKAVSAQAIAEAVYMQKLSEAFNENLEDIVHKRRKAEEDLLDAQIKFREEIQGQVFSSIKNGNDLASPELASLKTDIWTNSSEPIRFASKQPVDYKSPPESNVASKKAESGPEELTTVTVEDGMTGKKCGIVFSGPVRNITGAHLDGKLLTRYLKLDPDDDLKYPFDPYNFFDESNRRVDIKRALIEQLGPELKLLMFPKVRPTTA